MFNDSKRQDPEQVESERPTKRLKALLGENDNSDNDDLSSEEGELPLRNKRTETGVHGFKVNHDFARRFEHNKKREELHKRE